MTASTEPRHAFDTSAAAVYLGVAPKTLANWRSQGKGPKYRKYSRRCVRYFKPDLDRWADTGTR